ncbi:thiol reductant ABC exporter subunit CydD [Terasakiella pusilla]|uniref:thiol reductant ABC exporter subunit CydD n=1 Tax=Terasakiella pusilla TaxID=64973 RepID=UPI003AA8B388
MQTKDYIQQQKQPIKALLRRITLTSGLNAMLLVLQMWLIAKVMNAIAFEGQSVSLFTQDIYIIVFLVFCRFILNTFAGRDAIKLGQSVTTGVQKELLLKIERLGPCAGAPIKRGQLSTLMVEGVEKFSTFFSAFLPALSQVALIPICVLVLVLPLDLISALVFMLTAPLIPLFMILIGKGAEQVNQNHWRALSRLASRLQESLRGLQTLKFFGATNRETQNIREISEAYKSKVMQVLRIAFLSSVTLEFFSTLSIALIAVFIGFRLLAGEMAFQDGFLILLLAPEFYQPLRNLGANYHVKMEAMAAADEIVKILNMKEPQLSQEVRTLSTPAKIVFENVSFAYEKSAPVLSDVNFEIAPGECVVLTGPSGTGKSTLLNLLLGFLTPDTGNIYLNGQTLTPATQHQWQREIAWLSQHPHLFDTTVARNVALDPDLQKESAVKDILRKVDLDKTIEGFPDHLLQKAGEQGRLMSGGEGRRLALARVLMKGAPVLVMDEPSANLDPKTEDLILESLKKLKKNKTTLLIVAHRAQTIGIADRILHLDGARLSTPYKHAGVA